MLFLLQRMYNDLGLAQAFHIEVRLFLELQGRFRGPEDRGTSQQQGEIAKIEGHREKQNWQQRTREVSSKAREESMKIDRYKDTTMNLMPSQLGQHVITDSANMHA